MNIYMKMTTIRTRGIPIAQLSPSEDSSALPSPTLRRTSREHPLGYHASRATSMSTALLAVSISTVILCGGLYLSAAISGSNQYTVEHPVDILNCTCSCWDGKFRGLHGRKGVGLGKEYKTFYFNFDKEMWYVIFIVLMFGGLMLHKTIDRMIRLVFCEVYGLVRSKRHHTVHSHPFLQWVYHGLEGGEKEEHETQDVTRPLRYSNFVLTCTSIYSNFYGLWSILNYINDRDQRMIYSQWFFTLTELISSYILYDSMSRYRRASAKRITYQGVSADQAYTVISISALHIFLALPEKILWGLFSSSDEAQLQKVKIRDMGLMSTDFLGLLWGIGYLIIAYRREPHTYRKPALYAVFVFALWIMYKIFCSFE